MRAKIGAAVRAGFKRKMKQELPQLAPVNAKCILPSGGLFFERAAKQIRC